MTGYDKYPETRVSGHDGDAWEGAAAVAGRLAVLANKRNHTLVVECYPGVAGEVLELVRGAFNPDAVIISDDVFYDGDELTERMQPHITDDRVRGVMYYGCMEDFVNPTKLDMARCRCRSCYHGRQFHILRPRALGD